MAEANTKLSFFTYLPDTSGPPPPGALPDTVTTTTLPPDVTPDMLLRKPAGDAFEIGLAMAGAVSGGAYMAGVLDFLIQALDAWEKAKAAGEDVPRHQVRIQALTGASAGSICTALLAKVLEESFPPVGPGDTANTQKTSQNPLYRAWVLETDIKRLLGSWDLDPVPGATGIGAQRPTTPMSLLDATALDVIGQSVFARTGTAITRPYVADTVHVAMTATNLRGRRCALPFADPTTPGPSQTIDPSQAHWIAVHDMVLRFAVVKTNTGAGTPRPDECVLRHPCAITKATDVAKAEGAGRDLFTERSLRSLPPAPAAPWDELVRSALASGAFPGGLAPRDMDTTVSVPTHRLMYLGPVGTSGLRFAQLPYVDVPGTASPGQYQAVDGGAITNEPIELTRTLLCGLAGRNPRAGVDAKAATILVDPFLGVDGVGGLEFVKHWGDKPDTPRDKQTWIPDILKQLFAAEMNQNRATTQSLAMAWDETVFSRYLIAPSRPVSDDVSVCAHRDSAHGTLHRVEVPNLASGCMSAFGGFLHESYRRHDFLLGRVNCQRFLKRHFRVPANNTLVKAGYSAAQQTTYTYNPEVDAGTLPVIPLIGALVDDEPLPAWPQPLSQPEKTAIVEAIERRLEDVYRAANKRLIEGAWGRFTVDRVWSFSRRSSTMDAIRMAIDTSLCKAGLGPF